VNCPQCQSNTTVIDSSGDESIRRRRQCESCGHRFTTYELRVVELARVWQLSRELSGLVAELLPVQSRNILARKAEDEHGD